MVDEMNMKALDRELGLSPRDWGALFDAVYWKRYGLEQMISDLRREVKDGEFQIRIMREKMDALKLELVEAKKNKDEDPKVLLKDEV